MRKGTCIVSWVWPESFIFFNKIWSIFFYVGSVWPKYLSLIIFYQLKFLVEICNFSRGLIKGSYWWNNWMKVIIIIHYTYLPEIIPTNFWMQLEGGIKNTFWACYVIPKVFWNTRIYKEFLLMATLISFITKIKFFRWLLVS